MTEYAYEYDLSRRFGLERVPEPPPTPAPTSTVRKKVDAAQFRADLRTLTIGLEVADLFTEAQDLNPFRNGCKMASKHIRHDFNTNTGGTQYPFGDVPIERHVFAPVLGFRRPT